MNRKPFHPIWLRLCVLGLALTLLSSCRSVVEVNQPEIYSAQKMELQAGFSPAEKAAIDKNCFEGVPVVARPSGKLQVVAREGYVLGHSSTLRGPLWVAQGVPADQVRGPGDRKDNFAPDPKLPPTERAELKDYSRSGYDRGHQAPAADFSSSQAMTDESFFLSNMSPQIGAGFNRAVWKYLEAFVREKILANGMGYVITGPLFYDPEEDDPATADGVVKIKWIGRGRVAVPTHFYKILVLPRPQGKATCVAFVLENRKYENASPNKFGLFVKSVDWIEQRAGINFMPDLDPRSERELESRPGVLEP